MSTIATEPWIVETLADVARFFGRHRDTVRGWRRAGMPGEPKAFDLSEIVRWKEANIAQSGRVEGDESRAEAERKKAWSDAGLAQLKLKEKTGELIEVNTVARLYARHATHARALWEQAPDRLLGILPAMATGEDKRRFRAEAVKITEDIIDTFHVDLVTQADQAKEEAEDGSEDTTEPAAGNGRSVDA